MRLWEIVNKRAVRNQESRCGDSSWMKGRSVVIKSFDYDKGTFDYDQYKSDGSLQIANVRARIYKWDDDHWEIV